MMMESRKFWRIPISRKKLLNRDPVSLSSHVLPCCRAEIEPAKRILRMTCQSLVANDLPTSLQDYPSALNNATVLTWFCSTALSEKRPLQHRTENAKQALLAKPRLPRLSETQFDIHPCASKKGLSWHFAKPEVSLIQHGPLGALPQKKAAVPALKGCGLIRMNSRSFVPHKLITLNPKNSRTSKVGKLSKSPDSDAFVRNLRSWCQLPGGVEL